MDHVVVGHVVQNLYTGPATPPDDAWWLARQSANNSFLYGPTGNQLTQPGDPGYGAATGSGTGKTLVNFTLGAGFVQNGTYTLLDWTGATPAGLGATDFTADATTFEIVGNSLLATVVPEPSACGLLVTSALGLLARRRRK